MRVKCSLCDALIEEGGQYIDKDCGMFREDWFNKQLKEVKESFKNSPEWVYRNSPLQEVWNKGTITNRRA